MGMDGWEWIGAGGCEWEDRRPSVEVVRDLEARQCKRRSRLLDRRAAQRLVRTAPTSTSDPPRTADSRGATCVTDLELVVSIRVVCCGVRQPRLQPAGT
eukprot:968950-Rhodomonas_salina.1